MAGLHLVIQMSKFRAPYLVRKRGIFYLQKRIPQQLTGHYGRAFVRKSLRTKDRLEASKLASQLVRGSEREWSELLFTVLANVIRLSYKSDHMQRRHDFGMISA